MYDIFLACCSELGNCGTWVLSFLPPSKMTEFPQMYLSSLLAFNFCVSKQNKCIHQNLFITLFGDGEGRWGWWWFQVKISPEPSLFAHIKYGSRRRVRPKIRHLARWIAAHACLKNEFMEDKKCHNLMTWLKCKKCIGKWLGAN